VPSLIMENTYVVIDNSIERQ